MSLYCILVLVTLPRQRKIPSKPLFCDLFNKWTSIVFLCYLRCHGNVNPFKITLLWLIQHWTPIVSSCYLRCYGNVKSVQNHSSLTKFNNGPLLYSCATYFAVAFNVSFANSLISSYKNSTRISVAHETASSSRADCSFVIPIANNTNSIIAEHSEMYLIQQQKMPSDNTRATVLYLTRLHHCYFRAYHFLWKGVPNLQKAGVNKLRSPISGANIGAILGDVSVVETMLNYWFQD